MSTPLPRQTLADQVYQYLHAQLANRKIDVDDRLNARQIATELKVSRTTANKAIEQLIEEGLVKVNDLRHSVVVTLPTKLKVHDSNEFEFLNQTDSTYEILLEKILNGELGPGKIIKERPLAIDMGVNPATLRRAAEWLSGDGLLERLPRRGWRVNLLTPKDIRDTYQIRILLESKVIVKTIQRITEHDLDFLEEETDRLIAMGEKSSVYERREADRHFHQKICEASGNRVFIETLEPLIRKVLLVTTVGFRYGRSSRSFEEHKVILKALRERNEKEAVKSIKSHLQNAKKFNSDIWEHK